MKKTALSLSAAALVLSLTACGRSDAPENNVVAEDVNAMTNLQELPPPEPAANAAAVEPTVETVEPEPAAPKPTSAKPAPAKPKPAPEPEPAPDPHAGHDMNNMN